MEFSEGRKDTPGRYKRDCDLSIIEWSILKKRKVSSWESIVHILLLRMGGKKNKELGGRLSNEAVFFTTDKDIGCKAR